jgi:ATP-dependent Lhr-like helicase
LRQVRKREPDGLLVSLSALDPLNLVGTLLPGNKVPRQLGARIVLRDGIVLGTLVAGTVDVPAPLPADDERAVRKALLREPDSTFPTEVATPH